MGFQPKQLSELEAKLDGGNVRTREQSGRKFSYVEGWHVIAEANRIFGFDAWDRETTEIKCVSEKPRKIGSGERQRDGFGVGYIAKVRVTVRADGVSVVREGTGYGSGIDADLGSAHESAIKEAETDAMKRALMTFGNPFGLALYDKDQENVERPAAARLPPPRQPAAPPPPPPTTADPKAVAETIAQNIKTAPHLHALDIVMDDTRARREKLPQVTQNYLTQLYEKRRGAMESVA